MRKRRQKIRPLSVILIGLLFSILPLPYGAKVLAQCGDRASGSWVDTNICGPGCNYEWDLTTDSSSNVRGYVVIPPGECSSSLWPVQGRYLGGRFFTVTASNPLGNGDPLCAASFTYDGSLASDCQTGSGTWSNSDGFSGFWQWQKKCELPDSETISSMGWADSESLPTIHKWQQTLLPQTIDMSGRFVLETSASFGVDTCWFQGSIYAPGTTVTGGSWITDAINRWGPDYIGYIPDAVLYYRSQRQMIGLPPSCGFVIPQRMLIECGTGLAIYRDDFIFAGMDLVNVSSGRGVSGPSQFRVWP